jgi:hypothetical protein
LELSAKGLPGMQGKAENQMAHCAMQQVRLCDESQQRFGGPANSLHKVLK